MQTVILSNQFELVIPNSIRDSMRLQVGQKFAVISKGKIIELVPIPSMDKMRGVLKGANVEGYRNQQERL